MSDFKLKDTYFRSKIRSTKSDDKAFLGVSLNSQTMKSVDLARRIFDWTIDNIGNFDLLIGDHLERFNYQALYNATEVEANEMAEREGAIARERLMPLIGPNRPFQNSGLISATDLCLRLSFEGRLRRLQRHYSNNSDFRSLIEEGVDAYLKRIHPVAMTIEKVKRNSVAYQLEELAMFEQMSEDGYKTFLYPGPHLPIMKHLVLGDIKGVSEGIESMSLIEIRLIRKNVR